MADQLLIRAYNVGCGDCIYVRIPGPNEGFHILADCGKKGGDELLEKAVTHLKEKLLPASTTPGRKRLDLIVATHRHEDHIKGFDPRWFADVDVRNIWLSVAMDPTHPQAAGINSLRELATKAMREVAASCQALSPEVELLASLYGVSNDAADELLMETLPALNGIRPTYVHTGMTPALGLPPDTAIHILAPEKDVDGYYLGEELDASLQTLRGFATARQGTGRRRASGKDPQPANISATDFRVLQSRMLSNGLAFAAKESSIQNNLSVVLLIEWKTRRLLFVGDAEWDGEFKKGKHNGSWNVMWEKHAATHLSKPVDFLKIGHHGSINATPPPAEGKPKKAPAGGVYAILDTILPRPKSGARPKAQAIVSTEREFYNPIPECKLMVDVASRVKGTRNYGARLTKKGIDPTTIWTTTKAKKNRFFERYEQEFLSKSQPKRTDLEHVVEGGDYVDVIIKP